MKFPPLPLLLATSLCGSISIDAADWFDKTKADPIPYGVAIEGKAGYVHSPYSPDRGYIDVRGFPKDAEVRDPYSGKVIRVPADYTALSPTPVNKPVKPLPAPVQKLPVGNPVKDKPGFVLSPYSPGAPPIDVRRFPKGTEVRDPYSGKRFLVP